jgi:hypothetical protein
MLVNVDRFVSPDGQRIILMDRTTGDVWMARRLPPAEAGEAVAALIPRWLASEGSRSRRRQSLGLIQGGP